MDAHGRSAGGRREEVLRLVRGAREPVSIAEIAVRLGIHQNTARFHLDTLVEHGQVERAEPTRRTPGRPPLLFRAVRAMDPAGPRHYLLLAEVLADTLATDPDPRTRAIAAGRTWGHHHAAATAHPEAQAGHPAEDHRAGPIGGHGDSPVGDHGDGPVGEPGEDRGDDPAGDYGGGPVREPGGGHWAGLAGGHGDSPVGDHGGGPVGDHGGGRVGEPGGDRGGDRGGDPVEGHGGGPAGGPGGGRGDGSIEEHGGGLVGESVERLVALLDVLGFAPERGGGERIGLRNCPFLELVAGRTQIVCPIHLGLMQGAMSAWGSPVTVDRLDPFVEPDLCVAHLTREGAR